jgi:hypothetical protein
VGDVSAWVRAPYTGGQPRPTHCIRGHELTHENVRIDWNDTGRKQRRCRECQRICQRESRARRQQQEANA